MKARTTLAIAIASLPAALCLTLFADDKKEEKPKNAIEWTETDAKEFTAKLEKASAAGEKWAKTPESIMLEYAGPFVTDSGEKVAATRNLRIWTKGEGLPKTLNVVLIDDGLFDDQIKSERHRLALSRQEDGKWKLHKAFESHQNWPKPGDGGH